MLHHYSFQDKKRDLSDILATVIRDEPRFISQFHNTVCPAYGRKHIWYDDRLSGRAVYVMRNRIGGDAACCEASKNDIEKLRVGSLLVGAGDSAVFRVTYIGSELFRVELAAANGSRTTVPNAMDYLNILSTPEEDEEAETEIVSRHTDWNFSQVFRKNIVLPGDMLDNGIFGSADNQLNRQTAFALSELARDLNRVALFGVRAEGDGPEGSGSTTGGLYHFAIGRDALAVDAAKQSLDRMIVPAGRMIEAAGGEPSMILCNPIQMNSLLGDNTKELQFLRSDNRRGAYVAVIMNQISSHGFSFIADPDMPETEAWCFDPSGLGIAKRQERAIWDEDVTPVGYDGIVRRAEAEITFVFRNAKQRFCRIMNLKNN